MTERIEEMQAGESSTIFNDNMRLERPRKIKVIVE